MLVHYCRVFYKCTDHQRHCLRCTEINAIFFNINDIDFAETANAQMTDKFLPPALILKTEKRTLPENELKLLGDISIRRFRPPNPKSFQQTIFD